MASYRSICGQCVLAGVLLLFLSACGRKGPLVPPEVLVPAAIGDLAAEQKGERLIISWSPPTRELGGRGLTENPGFRLLRREVLPPAEDCEECPTAYRLVREISPDFLQGVRRSGGRFLLDDGDLKPGVTYQYKIVSVQKDGAVSPPSNRARRLFHLSPSAPLLKASASTTAVELQWPAVAVTPDASLVGYNVYRCRAGETMPTTPLNAAPLTETAYEDLHVERGGVYRYGVRAVVRMGGDTVESPLSNEVNAGPAERE